MKFTRPRLPYSETDLEPIISKNTIEYHYGKHEQAYIDKLNDLIKDTKYEDMSLEKIICESDGVLYNQAAQAWNHIFYFFQFSPNGMKAPSGKLEEQIKSQFGSVEDFKKKFEEAGAGLFGSGWVWLSADETGKLYITQGKNAENPMSNGLRPLLVFDVWEHAYYLDYQNRRPEYLHKIWDILDWDIINERYGNYD